MEQQAAGLEETALAFEAAGCSIVPVRADGTKAPAAYWKRYQDQRADPGQIRTWLAVHQTDGIGVITGTVSGNLEMLELEGRAVEDKLIEAYAQLLTDHGHQLLWKRITAGYLELTPSGGLHVLYRVDGETRGNTKLARRPAREDELTDEEREVLARHPGKVFNRVLLETRGEGGFVVVAPSAGRTHPSGKPWVRLAGGPATIATITEEERDALYAIASLLDTMPAPAPPTPTTGSLRPAEDGQKRPGDDFNERADWADILTPHGWTHVTNYGDARGWCRPGKTRGVSATTGRGGGDNLYVFSSSTEFECETPYSKFAAYALLEHRGDYAAAARELARQGYGDPMPHDDEHLDDLIADYDPKIHGPFIDGANALATVHELRPGERPRLASVTERTLHQSDDANALRLVDRFGETIRYCPDRGKWLAWAGTHWQWCEPGGGIVREYARRNARSLPDEEKSDRHFKQTSLSARGISAAVTLAQTDERIVVAMADLDAHPFELNTPGGIADLRTGELTPPDPARLHTRLTACAPEQADTPRWTTFLADTFDSDTDMIGFVQRLAGYSASADVRHHILPFPHGGGQNGKSVLMDALRALLGDYATTAPPGFLMEGKHEHASEVARLQGLRLVVASEVNQNSRFDEAKLKELTGGDTLTARFMRQDFFTFQPTHHLWLMANHKPQVKAGGDSFWRRLRLVPFNHRVPDEKKIENLSTLLVSEEGPGILAWIIRGAVDVFANGLQEPESVMAETRAYAEEEDHLGRFLEECCRIGGGKLVTIESKVLRAAYERWCHLEGEQPLSSSPLGRELKLVGVNLVKSNGKRFYTNVSLNEPAEDHWSDR